MGKAWELVSKLDERGGVAQSVARGVIGVSKSAKDSAANRHLSTVRWSRGRGAWVHRWPNGRVADPRRWSTPLAWATRGGNHDMEDLLWCNYRPQRGDTVFDIGAGHGGETFFLAPLVGTTGRVLSVEAAPEPFRRLEELVGLNGWNQVEPIQVALSDRAGSVSISDDDEDHWVAGNLYAEGGVSVPAATLDDLCAERGIVSVDWLKMNIEGAEKDAVKGMEKMAPHVRHMTISCHDFLGTEWGRSKTQVLEWLKDHGFETRVRGTGPGWEANYVYAWRT